MASDIHIGDMVWDYEAEGNLFGMVVEKEKHGFNAFVVEWNDGSRTRCWIPNIRLMKQEWHKLRKKCLTKKRK